MRIVPSLVAQSIVTTYPWVAEGRDHSLGPDQAPNLAMIVELLDALDETLLPTSLEDRTSLVAALGAMRGALQSWTSGGHPGYSSQLFAMPGLRNRSPVRLSYEILVGCSDEPRSQLIAGFEFVLDRSLRDSLRADSASSHRALLHGEYKASTVLAGSVSEALLLQSLQAVNAEDLTVATERIIEERRTRGAPIPDKRGPVHWHLADFVDVAEALKVISPSTATSVRLSNEFRNLIHPGRAQRTGKSCSLATALTAVGGMMHVIDELSSATR